MYQEYSQLKTGSQQEYLKLLYLFVYERKIILCDATSLLNIYIDFQSKVKYLLKLKMFVQGCEINFARIYQNHMHDNKRINLLC